MNPLPTPTIPEAAEAPQRNWQFWIDRGGTFTDVVAIGPDQRVRTAKLLSDDPEHYRDAAVAGIRRLLGLAADAPIPAQSIAVVKMGTTVATNALLERTGEPVLLVVTAGFRDALRIAYQNRPRLFDRYIELPESLHREVVEIDERLAADGSVVRALDEGAARRALHAAVGRGLRAVAIVLMHGYRNPAHEVRLAELAAEAGFTQVSVSHRGLAADPLRGPRRYHRRRCLPVAGAAALRRPALLPSYRACACSSCNRAAA